MKDVIPWVLSVMVIRSEGILVCRSEFESPEVDGEILVKYTAEAFEGIEPHSLVGEFLNVRITAADEYDLSAEVI